MSESPPQPKTRNRRRWIPAAVLGLVVLLAATLVWLLASHGGTVALARLAGLATNGRIEIEVAEGTLLGHLRLSRLRYADATTRIAVRDLLLDWTPGALMHGKLEVATLTAAELEVANAPSTEAPSVPQSLRLPLSLSARHIAIGVLKLAKRLADGDEPQTELTHIEGRLDSDGQVHRVIDLRLNTPFGAVDGNASLGADQPFPLQAQMRLTGSRDAKDYVVHATVAGPLEQFSVAAQADVMDSQAQATVLATPFRAVPFARIQARAEQVDPALFQPGAPHASLTANVDLRPLASKELALSGTIDVTNGVPGPADQQRLPLRALTARVAWAANRLALDDIQLLFPGKGSVAGGATWANETLQAQLTLRLLDLREIASVLKPTQLGGEVKLVATQSEQSMQAELRDPRFSARLAADRRGETVEVKTVHLESKGAAVDASGKMALDGRQDFDLRAKLSRFDPSLFADVPRALLNAELTARGELQPQPAADVAFSLRDSSFDNKPLAGQGRVQLLPDRLAQADVTLDLAGNSARAKGAFGRPGDQLSIAIDAPRLATLGHGLAGTIKGEAVLIGTLAQPTGRIDLVGDKLAFPGDQHLAHLSVKGELRDGLDGRFNLRAQVLQYRSGKRMLADDVELSADGTRHDHVLKTHGRLGEAHDLVIEAAGALQAGPAWAGTLRTLNLTGKPPLHLLAPVALELASTRVVLGPADLRSDAAQIQIKELVWTPRSLVTRGQIRGIPVSLDSDTKQKMVVSENLRLGGEWQIRLGEHADGTLRVSRESGDLVLGGDQPIAAGLSVLEARITALNDRLGWSLEATGSRLGQISGAGTALAEHSASGWRLVPNAPVTGALRASMPSIQWLGSLIDPDLKLDGALHAQVAITGTGAQPRGQGTIRGEKLTVASVEYGTRLTDGDLRVDFDEARVRLETLAFTSDNRVRPRERRIDVAALTERPGRLSASGDLELASGKGNLRVDAERLVLAQRPDRWLMLSGSGSLESAGTEGLQLTGKLRIDGGYLELTRDPPPSLSDDVVVKGRQVADAQHPLPLSMDVTVNMGRSFYFRGRGLDSRLAGEVRVLKDSHGPLRASGSIATRGGSFDAYGQELSIERGIVNFQGPLDNPGLNVLALRKNLPVEAGVSVTGPVNNPQIKLVSEPDVPDSEKLSWIVFGHGLDQSGGGDSAVLLSAANSILGGQSGGGVSRQLAQSLGFDDIGISRGQLGAAQSYLPARTVAGSQSAGSDANLTQQILTVGKRLSANAYLSFERSLSGAQTIAKITYHLTRRLSLIGRAGADNALDLFYTYSFK